MNLYRKIRPTNFEEVYGNEVEIKAFKKLLEKGNSQCFIIAGESGCGKTTLARIGAAFLGADATSIQEVNSSNNRGIDTARDIQQDLKYTVPDGKAKVYIIDEAHGTTKDWKRAMLKPLEDTPKRTYFFLCTTDLKQLFKGDEGKAIKTRCKVINVKPLKADLIYRLLKRTCKKEGFEIDKEVMEEISENCAGSCRQALEDLEKICDLDDTKSQLKALESQSEVDKETKDLSYALMGGKPWGEISSLLNGLKDTDHEKIRYAVLGMCNAYMLKPWGRYKMPQVAWVLECFCEPFYNSGRPGLTLASFQSINQED